MGQGAPRLKKIPGQVLSDAALRNIKVDSIAEDYLPDTCQPQTSENAEHVDAQAISICIQGTRITGQYEDAIRESIDGSYLCHYLSVKHKWSDSTWSWIDWYSHERHLKVLKGACLYQRLKFIHDWQPTNSQKTSSRSPTMPQSGSAHVARQPLKTTTTFFAVPLKRAPAAWRYKIFATPLNKQYHQLVSCPMGRSCTLVESSQ